MSDATNSTEEALFRQLADAYDAAVGAARAALRLEPGAGDFFEAAAAIAELRKRLRDDEGFDAYEAVVSESLRTLAHSFLAVLEGASADHPEERVVITDIHGRPLEEGLHERWVGFLLDTGRLE